MSTDIGPVAQQGIVSTQMQQVQTAQQPVEQPEQQVRTESASPPPPPPPPPEDASRGTNVDVSA